MSGCACGSGVVNHGSLEEVAVAFRVNEKGNITVWL